jgi:hypothetical protein
MPTIRRNTPANKASSVSAAAAAKTNTVKISSIKNADGGLKTKFDASKQTLTISGKARGIETRDPTRPNATYAERQKMSDYEKTEEFGGTISFDFDHDQMPNFDTSNGYTEKNKWYFAHGAEVGTKEGQSAAQVAMALAAKVNAAGKYKADVKPGPDGSATISITRR